jgi:hypothetical protein
MPFTNCLTPKQQAKNLESLARTRFAGAHMASSRGDTSLAVQLEAEAQDYMAQARQLRTQARMEPDSAYQHEVEIA